MSRRDAGTCLEVHARVPARDVDVELVVGDGQVLALLGQNGAGKSTVLDLIAGLVAAEPGSVRLGGRDLARLPAHRRPVALLAQDPLLFPHLSAAANVAFPARCAGVRRTAARHRATELLESVGVGSLAGRRPAALSGGQAQRVAIARALAAEPEVLLLDEPLAALDAAAAPAIRTVLRTVLRTRRRMAVLVTHDVVDVLALADEVAVLDHGRVVERGSVTDVLTRPRSSFAARLAGVNLVRGAASDDGLRCAAQAIVGGRHGELSPGEAAAAVFAPAAVAIHPVRSDGSPRNVFAVEVVELENRGGTIRVYGAADGLPQLMADVTAAAVTGLGLHPGQRVWFAVKATEVSVYPA